MYLYQKTSVLNQWQGLRFVFQEKRRLEKQSCVSIGKQYICVFFLENLITPLPPPHPANQSHPGAIANEIKGGFYNGFPQTGFFISQK